MYKPKRFKTKILRSTRAISPVIATLLVIAITVIASLVAYAWITGYIGGTTTDAGNMILIQSASYSSDDYRFLIVYVQNTGQGTIHLKQDTSVYVNDALQQIRQSPQGTSIAPGALIAITVGQTVEVVTDYRISPGERVRIKIVTVEGTTMEFTDKPSEQTTPVSNNRYNLNVNVEGSGTVSKSPNQPNYAAGQVVQLVPSAQRGWQFGQWSGDLSGSANPGSITMDAAKSVTATFTQIEYTLQITKVGTGAGEVTKNPERATYHLGDTVTLTATATSPDSFVGWSGDVSGSTNPITLTIDENPQVTATFVTPATQYSLTVTSNPANGGLVNANPAGPYTSEQSVTLTPVATTGYAFSGWSGDLQGNANPATVSITKNMVITANFVPSAVSLTLTKTPSYAGEITANPAGPYQYGDVVQLTAVPNTPFEFANWGQDLAGSTNPVSITLNGNKAVTANFAFKEYTLDLQQLGQGVITKSPDKPTYHLGDVVTLTAIPEVGWALAGWTGDKTSSQLEISLTIDENPSVLATFTKELYSLTVRSNPEAGGPVRLNNTGPNYYYNDVVELTPDPVYGYHFVNWEGDLTGTDVPTSITITRNMIVTANFEADPVTLTVNVNPADSGTVNQVPLGPYRFGDQVELTAVPAAGYTFSGWNETLGSTNPLQLTLYGDTTITANFQAIEYPLTITIQPSLGGSVTQNPSKSTYHLNENVQLTAQANPGYSFAGWSGDATGSTNPITLTIDENPQVTAIFTQTQYSLTTTANPSNGGTITRNGTAPYTYVYNDKVVLTAVPATGYTFTGWSEGTLGTANPATLTITGNMVVTANFAPIDVTLDLTVNPAGKGTITANLTSPYHYGNVVQLTAVATDEAYEFSSWSGDASGTANPVTITLDGTKALDGNVAVTANFALKPIQNLVAITFDNPDPLLWDLSWNDWGNPPWGRATDQVLSGVASAKCIGGNTGTYEPGAFTSDSMNTQGALSITISFDYRLYTPQSTHIDATDFQIYASGSPGSTYSASRFNTLASLGGGALNTWIHYTTTITQNPNNPNDPYDQYFTSTFRFGFLSQSLPNNAAIWVDNISITKQIA